MSAGPEGPLPASTTNGIRVGLRQTGPASDLAAGHLQGPDKTVAQRTDHLLSLVIRMKADRAGDAHP
jgi:hypothetical protein